MVLAHIFPSPAFCRTLREEAIFLEPYVNFYRINNVSDFPTKIGKITCLYLFLLCFSNAVISISVMFAGYTVVISI